MRAVIVGALCLSANGMPQLRFASALGHREDIRVVATQSALFVPCASNPTANQTWNFTAPASEKPGQLHPLTNYSLCLMAPGCSNSSSPLIVAPCATAVPPSCLTWTFDTYTYFTFTNTASQLLLTDNGPGAPASATSASSSPSQAFQFTGGQGSLSTIQPADNSQLCLTAQ